MQPVELLGQILDGGEELGDIHIKGNDSAAGNRLTQKRRAGQVAHAAQVKQTQDRADVQHIHQRPEHAENKNLLLVGLGKPLAFLAELRHFFILAAENLRDLDTGKIFRQVGVDIRRRVLDLAVGAAGEFAENHRENHDERHKAQHHQRQLIVEGQHGDENAEDDEDVLGQRDQQVREHHRDSVRVVGHAGDELADRDFVQLLVGQRLNVGEQIFAQVGDNALADALQNDGLEVGACHRKHQHARIDGHARKEARQRKLPGHQFFQRTDDEGRDNVVGNREQHQKQHNDKFCPVRLGVPGQAAQDLAVLHRALKAHRLLFVLDKGVGENQNGRDRADDAPDEKQRIQVSHCRHLPLHLPAFAGLPCGGIRCRYGTIRRAGLRPPPCRPR